MASRPNFCVHAGCTSPKDTILLSSGETSNLLRKWTKSLSSIALLAVADGISSSEKAHFYLGKFHDETYKGLSSDEKQTR